MNKHKIAFLGVLILFVLANSCKRDEMIVGKTDYPDDIAYILETKCTRSTCHNGTDKAGELDVTSWQKIFEGSDAGAVIIPYRPDYSSLMYFVNTYADIGPTTTNPMPRDAAPLTRDEVNKLKAWITAGAPDNKGNIKFSGNPSRKKYYVVNQGCRVVTVFDAETNLPMRYVDIADASEYNTSPHEIKISPDGQYWYVCYIGGSYVKRYRTTDDGFDGKVFVGNANWNTMAFTPDSKYLFVVDWTPLAHGMVKKCDLSQMKVVDSTLLADSPHGSCVSPDGKNLYITATNANYVYKINVDSLSKPATYEYIDFNGGGGVITTNTYNPHQVVFSPDGTKYYVSCSGNNNVGDLSVKVFDAATDNMITSITLPSSAYEMSISTARNLMFISSYDGTTQYPNGQVMVVDISSNSFVTSIETGIQPHGIAVDDQAGFVYVANRNISNTNPPHHSSLCGGINGTVTYIDLTTLELIDKEVIISRDPYYIAIRP